MLDVITQAQIWNVMLAITYSAELAARVSDRIIEFDDLVRESPDYME